MLNKGLVKWSQADPAAAAEFLNRRDTRAAFATVANGIRPDLAAASTWSGVGENFAAKNPSAALDWAQRVGDSNHGQFAIQGAIRGWWQNDPKAAADYVVAHADEPIGQQMATNLATSMALQDPGQATKWVDQLPNEEARKQAESGLVEVMSHRDPAAAAQLMQNMPAGMEQTMALGTVVSGWAEKDPRSAAQWIAALDGPMQDEAMAIFSSSIASHDPATALAWAGSINDESKRNRYFQQTARAWLSQDPASARTWIQNSSLGNVEKTRLLSSNPGN